MTIERYVRGKAGFVAHFWYTPAEPSSRGVAVMKWLFGSRTGRVSRSPQRERNVSLLAKHGFLVSPGLPERIGEDAAVLRPIEDIAGRLGALNSLFMYVAAPESAMATDQLMGHIDRAGLRRHLTESETEILSLPRTEAGEKHGNAIGWRTENAAALAWVLGHEPAPAFDGTMMLGDQIRPLVTGWPPIGSDFAQWVRTLRPRTLSEVAAMEDLFYCAHNAARSAQIEMSQAKKKPARLATVPAGFDPVSGGGVIHERRHALSWAVSPGVAWDDTDLST